MKSDHFSCLKLNAEDDFKDFPKFNMGATHTLEHVKTKNCAEASLQKTISCTQYYLLALITISLKTSKILTPEYFANW